LRLIKKKVIEMVLMATNVRTVQQGHMTSECWSVQIWGLEKCATCEQKGKRDCGGKQIRKTGKNSSGFTVPI
jgi:hypothetical protein